MADKGTCKEHGEFILTEGCAKCLALKIRPAPEVEAAIALRPGEDLEARGYHKEALEFLKYAEGRVVANADDAKVATDDLSSIANLKKVMDNKRKSLLEPLKLQADEIRETYTYLMAPVLEADRITRSKVLAYQTEQERKKHEADAIEREKRELAEREAKLKGEPAPTLPPAVTTYVNTSTETDAGLSSITKVWKWEIEDFSQVPDLYKLPDNGKITAAVKSSKGSITIPGIRIYQEGTLRVEAKR